MESKHLAFRPHPTTSLLVVKTPTRQFIGYPNQSREDTDKFFLFNPPIYWW